MRHRVATFKVGRSSAHRRAMLANMVCSLIKHKRITTTLAKAKALRPVAEKVMTLARKSLAREALIREALSKEGITDEKIIRKEMGKRGGLHYRRLAVADIKQEDAVAKLFKELAPVQKERAGGYTRIIHAAKQRRGDASRMAIIEWVEDTVEAATTETPAVAKADLPAPATVAEVKAEEAKAEEVKTEEKPAENEAPKA